MWPGLLDSTAWRPTFPPQQTQPCSLVCSENRKLHQSPAPPSGRRQLDNATSWAPEGKAEGFRSRHQGSSQTEKQEGPAGRGELRQAMALIPSHRTSSLHLLQEEPCPHQRAHMAASKRLSEMGLPAIPCIQLETDTHRPLMALKSLIPSAGPQIWTKSSRDIFSKSAPRQENGAAC